MTFLEDFKKELNAYGLPEGGNPALELGTAIALVPDQDVQDLALAGYKKLEIKLGLIAKKLNADGSQNTDQVTFDDMRGLLALGSAMARRVRDVCISQKRFGFWIYSNTGKVYPSAIVRPWDRAYINLLADGKCGFFESLCLAGYFWDCSRQISPSGARMAWVAIRTLERSCGDKIPKIVSRAIQTLKKAIDDTGGIHNIFREYSGVDSVFFKYSGGM